MKMLCALVLFASIVLVVVYGDEMPQIIARLSGRMGTSWSRTPTSLFP